MKRPPLALLIALVLAANAFALFHAWRNRTGAPDAVVALTQRELYFHQKSEEGGVMLRLAVDPDLQLHLDRPQLAVLGFDVSADLASSGAHDFYARQLPRSAYVAFEYEGPAWQKFASEWSERPERIGARPTTTTLDTLSRLSQIDAAATVEELRARHPDRSRVFILPCVVSLHYVGKTRDKAPSLDGTVSGFPAMLHVPLPFNRGFDGSPATYQVRLTYGSRLEPWVTAVTIGAAPQ